MLIKYLAISILIFGIMATMLDILIARPKKTRPQWFPTLMMWLAVGFVVLSGLLAVFILWTGL